MKRPIYALSLMTLMWVTAEVSGAAQPQGATTTSELGSEISRHLSHPNFARAFWGVKVVSATNDIVVFDHNSHKLMSPGSNAKLFTTALALHQLGPEYRFKTFVYSNTRPDAKGAISGDLTVYGTGDPTLSHKFNYGAYQRSLKPLVDSIVAAGIKRVGGDLVADESFFYGATLGGGWKWEHLQHSYGAAASALSIDDNIVHYTIKPGPNIGDPCLITGKPETSLIRLINQTVTTDTGVSSVSFFRAPGDTNVYFRGSVSIRNPGGVSETLAMPSPAATFVEQLHKRLIEKGIIFEGKTRVANWLERQQRPTDYAQMARVAEVESRPLSEIIHKTLKSSHALYSQLLLLHVGSQYRPLYPSDTRFDTETAGLKMMETFLLQANIKPEEVLLEDGAGLSRDGLVTANATVGLLKYMAGHRYSDVYTNSFPVAGVDGTLAGRFTNTGAKRNLRAKTGTLPGVAALSGYLTNASGEPLVFSIMLNNSNLPEPDNKSALDSIANLLASSTNVLSSAKNKPDR